MRDLLGKAVSLGLGFAIASKEQAEKVVEELVKKGEVNKDESKQFVDELVRKGQEAQASLEEKVRGYMISAAHELNLTTKDDYVRLKQRVSELERRVAELEEQLRQSGEPLPPAES
ncbi:hypothetical protein DVH26_13200 [Paenibacillus sp. H1-7]|uniref:phasin family protein n=1 Tax=Paenibacillus sp. H1-7 TaxID=2282849 RepID=UPI001EF91220|nr:hypothetical protein [Paenibacillus sp. H1-7]ULL15307.1 hypothetical protein DVH26_13200 [Paenibacillus sp. H1-7]